MTRRITPCEQMGYKVGDRFIVIEENTFPVGSLVELEIDDGTKAPSFIGVSHNSRDGDSWNYINLHKVAPVVPITLPNGFKYGMATWGLETRWLPVMFFEGAVVFSYFSFERQKWLVSSVHTRDELNFNFVDSEEYQKLITAPKTAEESELENMEAIFHKSGLKGLIDAEYKRGQ